MLVLILNIGKVFIYNDKNEENSYRSLSINRGVESRCFTDEGKHYDLSSEYTKYYDLCFKSNIEIKNTLMIGGAGYSYPKYYISHYPDKSIDVIEIDEKLIDIAKKYFYLDELIQEYDLENNNRLNNIVQDGRVYLNQNTKKYDAIFNDAFSGVTPEKTLTTLEVINKIHDSLNENGMYLTNIISSLDNDNSKFLKAEINTLKQVFRNVYAVPCNTRTDINRRQNIMVVATDDNIYLEDAININIPNDEIILTDNYCPIENLIK